MADRQRFPIPKVLLLDLGVPKMNGWEVLAWVRADPHFAELLVVVFTSFLQVGELKRIYKMGGNSFLLKPCIPEDLVALAKCFPKHWRRSATRGSEIALTKPP